MRNVLLIAAVMLLVAPTLATAEHPPSAIRTVSNPLVDLISTVRERLSGNSGEAAARQKGVTDSRAKAKATPRPVRPSGPVPWPRRAPKTQHAEASHADGQLDDARIGRTAAVKVVSVAGELLALPPPSAKGLPVHLNVPSIGRIEVPEERYREIFALLVSDEPPRQQEALNKLRDLKDATEALRQWARKRGHPQGSTGRSWE
jgi:hypothetical protein